ncbi:MAG: FAD-dependent thymidylate synthase, partial [Negativicutes bacterium]|nr:FAD-dependent thymidylate synthase [Negativicutes bacterium]
VKELEDNFQRSLDLYNNLLERKVAPEEARMVLPLNTMTHWVWSGSLMAFMRVYLQRADGHAQLAAQEFANELGTVIESKFPSTFEIFKKYFG